MLALEAAGVGLLVAGLAGLLLAPPGLRWPASAVAAATGLGLVVAAEVVVAELVFWCPWCRENLGPLLTNRWFWRVDPKLASCPFCGTDLDDPIGGAG